MNTIYADASLPGGTSQYNAATRSTGGTARQTDTVNGALQLTATGDTVVVRGGRYAERQKYAHVAQEDRFVGYFVPHAITLKVAANESAVLTFDPANLPLDYDGTLSSLLYFGNFFSSTAALMIDGTPGRLAFVGCRDSGTVGINSSTILVPPNLGCPLTLKGIDVSGANHCGVKSFDPQPSTLFMDDCDVHDNGMTGLDHGIYIADHGTALKTLNNCRWWGHPGYGIHAYSVAQNCVMNRNYVHGNRTGGILLTGSGHKITSNWSRHNGKQGNLNLFNGTMSNLTIKGNDLRDSVGQEIIVGATLGTGNVFDGNRHAAGQAPVAWTTVATNEIIT